MDSTTPAQLKPCPNPWCKSQGKPFSFDVGPYVRNGAADMHAATCVSCGLQYPDWLPTEAEAIAAWNQRPAQDSTQEAENELVERFTPDALVERLRATKTQHRTRPAFGGMISFHEDDVETREVPVNPDGPEAADTLAAMQERIERLEKALANAAQGCPQCEGKGEYTLKRIVVPCEFCEIARTALGRGE